MKGFRGFLLRGNVIDLAVGIVIGAAFTTVVNNFVAGFLTPLVGVATGSVGDYSKRTLTIGKTTFAYGAFINGLIAFVLVAMALYYLVILPTNRLTARFRPHQDEAAKRDCPECLSSIPAHARRCSYCTIALEDAAPVTAAAPAPRTAAPEEF